MRLSLLLIVIIIGGHLSAQLKADFSVSGTQGCSPFTVQFKDNSTGLPTSWFWDFGDGQTSTLQNPSVTYTTTGNYSVRLIVKNASGQDYKEKNNYISVAATPIVQFDVITGDSGCVNLLSSFKDNSQLQGATVKSWLWDFGDGGTSAQQNPSHSYTAEGKYNVSLTVQTTQGCSATYTINSAVSAGNKPDPDFTASPLNGCASTLRDFKNKSGNATAYQWDFGDNSIGFDKNPQHHYRDTGFFTVKLLVSENGCTDSAIKVNYIHVDGTVAKFNPGINCGNMSSVDFRDNSINETSRLWKFGDGQTSILKSLTHIYNTPGVYYVELDVTGTTCNDTAYDTLHINTSNPKIKILPQKNIYCRNDTLSFVVTGFDSAITKLFAWNDGDNYTSDFGKKKDTLEYVYRKNESYVPVSYIKDIYNCFDTVYYNSVITVDGPYAEFQSDPAGCTNSIVNFNDQSTSGNNAPINKWQWSFGDGGTSTSSGPLTYTYTFPVTYNASLKVTDKNGCSDSIIHQIKISDAPIVDAGANAFACANNNITLNATGATTYVWAANPDLSCTNCANPIATPSQSETYYVTGTNDGGCSATDSVHIDVQTKELVSAQPNSYSICQGDSATLNVSGADNYVWSPAASLSSTTTQNPSAFPSSTTSYTVIGKDSNNCFADTAVANVTVNPLPAVNIIDSSISLLAGSTFNITTTNSSDAINPQWLPASGLSCYNCFQPVATVTKTLTYTLQVSNEFGCVDSDRIRINAICTSESVFIPNTFSPNNDGMNDYFFPRSGFDIPIKSFTIFNRWGQMIFQKTNFFSNNFVYGWDGKFKNVAQDPDVYIYVMEMQCTGSGTIIKKGNVTLIR
ncbi:MAG: PKD domain-containing protein [Parafilimonas sp.]|nr:PKD domain-containing protein [Parafilimonas sp.]